MFVNGVINGDIYKTERVYCCLPHFMLSVKKIFVAVEGTWFTVGTCLNLPCAHNMCSRVWWHQSLVISEFGGVRVWWRQSLVISEFGGVRVW